MLCSEVVGHGVCVQDSQDPNPLIRALAVRTMGCIRVDKITEYLCDPLERTLKVFNSFSTSCQSSNCTQRRQQLGRSGSS